MQHLRWDGRDHGQLLARATRLLEAPGRSVLGVAGAPASGKSTLAELLHTALTISHPGTVVLVGMDGFHLGHEILQRRGQVDVKGAPHTFDVLGYVALLQRIRVATETVYAPEFHREIEDSVAHNVEIPPEVRLVVTEGNYLLLPQAPWADVRPLLDEAWFVHLDDDERRRRMLARHLRYGHDLAEATARTNGSDERNAQLVNHRQSAPDLWIEQEW